MPAPLPAPVRSTLGSASRRFLPLLLLSTALGGGAAAALSYNSDVEHTGTATYLVPPGKTDLGVVTPYDAERIARTYAIVVANDASLLSALAGPVGRGADEVSDRTTTTSLPNSAAVRVTYRGDDRREVQVYFSALTEALESPTPPTRNVTPGTVRLLKVDDEIPTSGGGSWLAVVAGAVAGLVLGLAGAAYLDRAHPRVRRARDLRVAADVPTVDVDLGSGPSLAALAMRLLKDVSADDWIAVGAVSSDTRARADQLVTGLRAATTQLVADGALLPLAEQVQWVPAVLGEGGERAAQDARRTLLVARERERFEDIALRLSDLHDLGVEDFVVTVAHGKPSRTEAGQPARSRRRERHLSDTATS